MRQSGFKRAEKELPFTPPGAKTGKVMKLCQAFIGGSLMSGSKNIRKVAAMVNSHRGTNPFLTLLRFTKWGWVKVVAL